MSITKEAAKQHLNDPAVVCCRTTKGTILGPGELEDPLVIPDLEESGLVELPKNVLKIGQVLGAKLLKDVDGLTPLTSELFEELVEFEDVIQDKENNKDNGGNKVEKVVANSICTYWHR
ncbi:sugar transporter [Metaclostridioides mangenotii]|uniref:sugar transporter n=1 Tax=Metaclostridioides mangenotii TaxID=1540 RepID=UPI0028E2ED87|nr:sugar transporter [Clostridioides mangenotii]